MCSMIFLMNSCFNPKYLKPVYIYNWQTKCLMNRLVHFGWIHFYLLQNKSGYEAFFPSRRGPGCSGAPPSLSAYWYPTIFPRGYMAMAWSPPFTSILGRVRYVGSYTPLLRKPSPRSYEQLYSSLIYVTLKWKKINCSLDLTFINKDYL